MQKGNEVEEENMRSGLGWRSLNPVEAVADVHSIENKDLLLRIAYEARNPEARRLALIKTGDKRLMASFAQSDSSPIVRRRMVRELDDIELVRRIAENDDDRSARVSDRGGHYAWGETGNKADYTWGTYKHGTSAEDLSKYSYTDNGIALQASDDAAHVNWGGAWRMPTGTEWEELCDRCNCTWEWTSVDETPGYRVTSKKEGYTDKSIFLPAAGYCRGCSIEGGESSGYYWSSTRNKPFADRAQCLYFVQNFIGIGNNGFRNGGVSVRPVKK